MRTRGGAAGLLAVFAIAMAPAAAPAHEVVLHGDPLHQLQPAFPLASTAPPSGRMAGTWCGTPRATDDVEHEVGDPALPKIKLVEAHPADRAPSAELRDTIQSVASQMLDHVAAESGGLRSLRFDLGTPCGPQYADIVTIKLPQGRDVYTAECPANPVNLMADLRARLPKAAGLRNATVFVSGVYCGAIAGWGQFTTDDRPGPENDANAGGHIALAISHSVNTALHETGHNLGAVQSSAPHSDQGGHCWDEEDVMCYPYTQLAPPSPVRPCNGGVVDALDCNKDDYFSPSPAPGSYLATHWNLFNSVFLCELQTCTAETPDPGPDPDPDPEPDPEPDPDPDPDPEPQPEPEPTPTPTPTPTPAPAPQTTSASEQPGGGAPAVQPEPRRAKSRLQASVRLRGRRARILARVVAPQGPAACAAGVTLSVKLRSGGRTVLSRELALDRRCRTDRRLSLRRAHRRLTMHARFAGTADLAPCGRTVRAVAA